MELNNTDLGNFINRIKLKKENKTKFITQIDNLISELQTKINDDKRTGAKITKVIRAGSWIKGTILRPKPEHPIDIDLVFYVEGDENLKNDLPKLHDFIAEYFEEIYPNKTKKDIDASGKTKSVKIVFSGTGLEVDVVPVIPVESPKEYVLQLQRGGGGKYITSVTKQLEFSSNQKQKNSSYTSIVRAIKWWRNYSELKDENLSSFVIELIVTHLDSTQGIETNIEEGIIRFFKFVSDPKFPEVSFKGAINSLPGYVTPIFVADPTNNENNVAEKILQNNWVEVKRVANIAFEALNIAQSKGTVFDTVGEWKSIFGPNFNINIEE